MTKTSEFIIYDEPDMIIFNLKKSTGFFGTIS